MDNPHVENIIQNIHAGTMNTALIRDPNSSPFPAADFSGLCFIRATSNPMKVFYSLRINYGKPARLLIKTSSIMLECNMQGLNDLWNAISEIEKQKRQKQK